MEAGHNRRLVGVSTKMYFTLARTRTYTTELLSILPKPLPAIDIFIIPDFLSLPSIAALLHDSPISLGAQDCSTADIGAYTGEVSASQLAEAGASIVELGHAERRRLFGETDADTALKAAAAARAGLIPLVCIGERERGDVDAAVEECRVQVQAVLRALPLHGELILAYEPVWAIGAAEPADAEHVVGVTMRLREMAAGRSGMTRVLYGGSAGPGLYEKLKKGVDGLFLGRFAHDPAQFVKTIMEIAEA